MATFKISEPDGSLTYELGTGHKIHLPGLGEADRLDPVVAHFEAAAEMLGDAVDAVAGIDSDASLSPIGKAQHRKPKEAAALEAIAQRWSAVDAAAAHLAAREAALIAVPAIEPSHSAVAIADREIRDWFRALSGEQRTAALQQIDNEPGHERVMVALMRSPVPGLDHEEKFVRHVWKRTKRLDNPAEAMAIDAGKVSVEWARRGLMNAAGVAGRLVTWDRSAILRTLLSSSNEFARKGYAAFGFGPLDAASEQRNIDAMASDR